MPSSLGAVSPSYSSAIGPAAPGSQNSEAFHRDVTSLLREILTELRQMKTGDSEDEADKDESESEENRRPLWRKVESIEGPSRTSDMGGHGDVQIPLIMRPPLFQNPAHFHP